MADDPPPGPPGSGPPPTSDPPTLGGEPLETQDPDGVEPDDEADTDEQAAEPEVDEASRRRRRRQLILLLTPLSLAVIAGYVAIALTPTLGQKEGGHPLILLALDARNRNLLLAAEAVDALPFYFVALTRLLIVDPFTYLLGRRYGDTGLRWVENRFASLKPTVDLLEGIFRRAGWLAVAIAPGAIVCTLAGASGMAVPVFLAANIVGSVLRIFLIREIGFAFSGPVDSVRRFFDAYTIPLTIISFALAAWFLWSDYRRSGAAAENPVELAEELEAAVEVSEDERP